MCGSELREPGRVGGRRLGQDELLGRLPHVGDETVEASRRKDQQRPACAVVGDAETVRHAPGRNTSVRNQPALVMRRTGGRRP